jgi:hypothetical protein
MPFFMQGSTTAYLLKNLRDWVANASKADQVSLALRNGRIARKRS